MNARRKLLLTALLLLSSLLPLAPLSAQSRGEHIIVSGGVALRKWENLRAPGTQHDRWWGNFIRPARVRIEQIQKQEPGALITWLVYRRSYTRRSAEDARDLIPLVESVRDKYQVRLIWFGSGADVVQHLNSGMPRGRTKIQSFEYFGHSNKYAFMFDYSCDVYGVSKSWLHQRELDTIRGGIFARDAFIKSWGCHTGESMSAVWRKATGTRMIGAFGKTDFSNPMDVQISPGGHWVQ